MKYSKKEEDKIQPGQRKHNSSIPTCLLIWKLGNAGPLTHPNLSATILPFINSLWKSRNMKEKPPKQRWFQFQPGQRKHHSSFPTCLWIWKMRNIGTLDWSKFPVPSNLSATILPFINSKEFWKGYTATNQQWQRLLFVLRQVVQRNQTNNATVNTSHQWKIILNKVIP